jgi:gamma-glutamyltranspeptidase/glutathione hydrolase
VAARPSRLLVLILPVLLAGCLLLASQVGWVPEAQPTPVARTVAVPDTTHPDAVTAEHGMVVSGHPEASRVGMEVLRNGGNAVDAAVATSFALAVTLPKAGNVGGGGFMVIRLADGTATTIDFRETAPAAATRDMYLDDEDEVVRSRSRRGHLASGVPGTVAGLLHALDAYGTMPRADLVDPAVQLAAEGFRLTEKQTSHLNRYRDDFLDYPSTAKYFIKADSGYFVPDETFVQSDLADVLRRIRDEGRDGFYRGRTADLIVAEMERGGGLITHVDLASYESVERAPVRGTYRDYRVISMPPPSSGGIALIQLLNAVEPVDLGKLGLHTAASVHRMAEAERRVFADRAVWVGDPDFEEVPVAGLLSKAYMRSRMASFDPRRTTPSEEVTEGTPPGAPVYESTETTHLSVVDAEGNAVSLTTTINDWYGSKVAVDGAGFLLNDEMDDFTAKPGVPNLWGSVTTETNAIEPGKRMLSSMTPTILEDPEGGLFLVLGSPGGPRIITTVFQTITGMIDFGLTLPEAVAASRFHHQWDPDELSYERDVTAAEGAPGAGFREATLDSLRAIGWALDGFGNTGAVSAVHVQPDGSLLGAFDRRRDVTPVGY